MTDQISEIEKILIEDFQIREREDDRYFFIKHDFNFYEHCKNFLYPYNLSVDSDLVPIKKEKIRELIKSTIETNQNSIRTSCWFYVVSVGEDANSSYTNHLSDIDGYYFNGNAILTLIQEKSKWKIKANIEGELQRVD